MRGFTLLEMMAVLAVIAILALMAIPSVPEKLVRDQVVGNFVSSTLVRAGAIHITFGNRANGAIKGRVLSVRPAVVADAPIVPVAWVCGNATVPDKMTVKGENRTNIAPILLPLKCRP
jgi:type IV pilus assembly protein PilA